MLLPLAQNPEASEEFKGQVLHNKYALERWKETSEADKLFIFPSFDNVGLLAIGELLGGEAREEVQFGVDTNGIEDDTAMDMRTNEKSSVVQCPVHLFSPAAFPAIKFENH